MGIVASFLVAYSNKILPTVLLVVNSNYCRNPLAALSGVQQKREKTL
jgi:hypothetical protein